MRLCFQAIFCNFQPQRQLWSARGLLFFDQFKRTWPWLFSTSSYGMSWSSEARSFYHFGLPSCEERYSPTSTWWLLLLEGLGSWGLPWRMPCSHKVWSFVHCCWFRWLFEVFFEYVFKIFISLCRLRNLKKQRRWNRKHRGKSAVSVSNCQSENRSPSAAITPASNATTTVFNYSQIENSSRNQLSSTFHLWLH